MRHSPRPDPAPLDTALLEGLRSHIALLDAEGRVVWVNRAWRRFGIENGAPPDAGVGRSFREVCERGASEGHHDAAAMLSGFHAVREDGAESFTLAYDCSGPDETRIFQAQITPVGDGGRRLLVCHDNITEAVEEARSQTRLDSLSTLAHPAAAAGAAGSMVSAELSGPLTALICALAGARRLLTSAAPDLPLTAEAVSQAIEQAERARALMAGLRMGGAAIGSVEADLTALAASAAATMGDDARVRAAHIDTNLRPARVRTDPMRVSLVLLAMLRHGLRRAEAAPLGSRRVGLTVNGACAGGAAEVRVDWPVPSPNGFVATNACGLEQTPAPFGLGAAARVAEEVHADLTIGENGCTLRLPTSGMLAA